MIMINQKLKLKNPLYSAAEKPSPFSLDNIPEINKTITIIKIIFIIYNSQ